MAQPKKVDRPVRKNICLPQSLVARVDLELWSDVEGKVPFAAWQGYVERLIRQDLAIRARAISHRTQLVDESPNIRGSQNATE